MQEHHDTAIKYLRQNLQEYRMPPSLPPAPQSKPRRVPKRTLIANPNTPPDPVMHKRALPAAFSILTRSVKRADPTRCSVRIPAPSPALATPLAPHGHGTGSYSQLAGTLDLYKGYKDAPDLITPGPAGETTSPARLRYIQQRSTPPHIAVPPPASRDSEVPNYCYELMQCVYARIHYCLNLSSNVLRTTH